MSPSEELALAGLVVTGTEKLIAIYTAAKSGSMSASAAMAHIQAMLDGLPTAFAKNDAEADAVVKARFPK